MAITASKFTNTASLKPTNKVISSAVVGAVVTIIVYVVNTYVSQNNPIPSSVASALVTVLSAVAAWFTPPNIDQTTI
jgi:membrane protein YdbS with pleckstrin-like domain